MREKIMGPIDPKLQTYVLFGALPAVDCNTLFVVWRSIFRENLSIAAGQPRGPNWLLLHGRLRPKIYRNLIDASAIIAIIQSTKILKQ